MQRISKFSVKQIFTGLSRQFAAKGGKGAKGGCDSKKGGGAGAKGSAGAGAKGGAGAGAKGGAGAGAKSAAKAGSECAPLKKFDLCEMKKGGKDGQIKKCGGVPAEDGTSIANMGGVGRKSSCGAKKPSGPKGSTAGALRKVCLFGILPAVFLLNILILSTRTHEERKEYKPWPHMYKRDKRFCWGDGVKSFFHNPHTNALPEIGYEDEI